MRSGALSGKTLAKVDKHIARAEELAGRPAAARAQLANAARVLDTSGDQGELRTALMELRDTL